LPGQLGTRLPVQSLAKVWSGQNGIPEALEEQFLALQHILVVVDAEKYAAQQYPISGYAHGFTFTNQFSILVEETVQNCSK
jgi:hypothetical protein